jgi:hypothetical protein
MTTPQNDAAPPVLIRVIASTDNENDEGYQHSFEQKGDSTLIFEVYTKPPVETIYFVLWNIHNPAKPYIAEPPRDWPVQNGHVTITIGRDLNLHLALHPHLGPGPYCAMLTASSSTDASAASVGGRKIVGTAIYYYDTWKDRRPYDWPV